MESLRYNGPSHKDPPIIHAIPFLLKPRMTDLALCGTRARVLEGPDRTNIPPKDEGVYSSERYQLSKRRRCPKIDVPAAAQLLPVRQHPT